MTTGAKHEIQRQFETGLARHREGQLGLAESHYARVVKLDPAHADAWHLLGVAAFQRGHAAKAIKHHQRALALRPGFAQAWNNLAIALKAHGDRRAAADAFARALATRPAYAEAAFNLALLHDDAGDVVAAEAGYRQALAWRGDYLDAATNLGNLLARDGRRDEAAVLLAQVDRVAPTARNAGNLAAVLIELGRYAHARALAERAVEGEPDQPTWWMALGSTARLQGDVDAAIPALERACALTPGDAMAAFELGLARNLAGDPEGARAAMLRARSLAPERASLRWGGALLAPAYVADEAAAVAAIAHVEAGVAELSEALPQDLERDRAGVLDGVCASTPYLLHYLPRDTTALQCRFGDLVQRAVAGALPGRPASDVPTARAADARIRIGFVSAYFMRHTVSRFFAPLWRALPADRFERFLWHTGETLDEESARSASAVDHFDHAAVPVADLVGRISAAALDVLVFPDLGMDPRQHVLASCRLAPVQAALYGHPITSGLPDIDVYFSGAALEPEGAQAHYRERLITLPGLGAAPSAPGVLPAGDWFRALRDDRPALLCLQHWSKLTPAFDDAVARILARTGARLFLFDRRRSLSLRVLARMSARLRAHGVDAERALTLLPMRAYPDFLGAIAQADLVLDTPWFSGGATSLDVIAMATPIVAWESPMARGRQTSAMLRAIGVPELACQDADAYVDQACRVLGDPAFATRCRERMQRLGSSLFDDGAEVVAAFARAVESLVGKDARTSD